MFPATSMRPVGARYRVIGPAIYWLLTAIGAVWCGLVVFDVAAYGPCATVPIVPCDAHSYWSVDDTPYVWEDGTVPFRYAPVFFWAMQPVQLLRWEVFLMLWTALHIAAFIWLRAGWMLVVPGLNEDVLRGNVSVFLAVAAVVAVQKSASWWLPVLFTKLTPVVGAAWHVARGEWRSLVYASAIGASIVIVGLALAPALWADWLASLADAEETYEIGHPLGPIWLRLGLGAAIAALAGRTSRAWLVPVAMVVASPGGWALNFAMLAAIPRLVGTPPRR